MGFGLFGSGFVHRGYGIDSYVANLFYDVFVVGFRFDFTYKVVKIAFSSRMDELEEVLGNNSLEDLSWLCSLSEAELVSVLF